MNVDNMTKLQELQFLKIKKRLKPRTVSEVRDKDSYSCGQISKYHELNNARYPKKFELYLIALLIKEPCVDIDSVVGLEAIYEEYLKPNVNLVSYEKETTEQVSDKKYIIDCLLDFIIIVISVVLTVLLSHFLIK